MFYINTLVVGGRIQSNWDFFCTRFICCTCDTAVSVNSGEGSGGFVGVVRGRRKEVGGRRVRGEEGRWEGERGEEGRCKGERRRHEVRERGEKRIRGRDGVRGEEGRCKAEGKREEKT